MFHHNAWAVGSYSSGPPAWELSKSKSTQPRSARRCPTLYRVESVEWSCFRRWKTSALSFMHLFLSPPSLFLSPIGNGGPCLRELRSRICLNFLGLDELFDAPCYAKRNEVVWYVSTYVACKSDTDSPFSPLPFNAKFKLRCTYLMDSLSLSSTATENKKC